MRHIVAKKNVKSLTQQQLFYENFVLSSEVRIKEKEKTAQQFAKKYICIHKDLLKFPDHNQLIWI